MSTHLPNIKFLPWLSNKVPVTTPVPIQINLELTTACNYSCQYCAVNLSNYRANKIQKEKAFQIIDDLSAIGYEKGVIQLSGHGESTILPWFEELLAYIREKLPNINISFHTNGSYLAALAEAIIKYRVAHISISVDAGTQDIFDEIRGKGSFKALIRGLDAIKEQKHLHQAQQPNLWFVATIMKTNIFDLEQLVKLAVQYQVTEVITQPLTPYQELNTQDLALSNLPIEEHQKVYEVVKRAKAYAQQHDMVLRLLNEDPFNEPQSEWHTQKKRNKAQIIESSNIQKSCNTIQAQSSIWHMIDRAISISIKRFKNILNPKKIYRDCTDPWQILWINARGGFYTCCFRHNDIKERLDQHRLMDVWYHSKGLNQVRKSLLRGQLDHICINCPTRPIIEHPPKIPEKWDI